MTVEEALEIVEKLLNYDSLNKIQEIVFRQAWEGKSYPEIAASTSYDPEYIKQVGFHLWQSLSKALGKKVTKNNFQSILKRYARQTQISASFSAISSTSDLAKSDRNSEINESLDITALENAIPPDNPSTYFSHAHQDWGDALDVSVFYGRTAELLKLEQWLLQERCRLVTILGMGGIGKTALCVKLAERIQEHFDYVIWRSLRNAPPVEEILTTLIKFLSSEQETNLPESLDDKILLLLEYLRSSRCLLVLDNAESILQSGNCAGQYRAGYESYGQLLRCVGETRHQSCLLLTSRERPRGLAAKEGKILPVRSLQISGLSLAAGKEIFQAKGSFWASENEWRVLIEHYAGNPLALKMVAAAICFLMIFAIY
jgi:ATP-dependent Clp protease ATP-binding subunit ClpA